MIRGFLNRAKRVPSNVMTFGAVSFLTDFSSDMIYPLLPIFIVSYLGAGQGFLGFVEGWAESTAAIFTLLSGIWADRVKDRGKLVLAGYSLSSLSRPLVAFATSPWMVFFVRFFDRIGKGTRTAPRDALIADSVHHDSRGAAFGLHRSMDHLGAVAGPLAATLLMSFGLSNLRVLFLLATIPGLLSVGLILWKVRDIQDRKLPALEKLSIQIPSGKIRVYFGILFLFILSCSSDTFLILRCKEIGVPMHLLPVIWMIFNLVKAVTTFPLGMISDKIGRRKVILAGWLIYALVYTGFAFANQPWQGWVLFIGYGLFYGFTEGSERAILADYAKTESRGQVYGWYYFIVGLGALPASLFFGFLWQYQGAQTAFLVSASISIAAAICLGFFLYLVPSNKRS